MGMSKEEEQQQARLEQARAIGLFRYMLIREAACCASLRMSVAASLAMSTPNRTFRAREWPTALMVAVGCSW